jgi:uncharacterized membrane protein YoaT (DUF817 family)
MAQYKKLAVFLFALFLLFSLIQLTPAKTIKDLDQSLVIPRLTGIFCVHSKLVKNKNQFEIDFSSVGIPNNCYKVKNYSKLINQCKTSKCFLVPEFSWKASG